MTVIDTPDGIAFYHLCAQRGALKLEIRGLKHSSGRSIYAHVKRQYGLKGNRASVLAQMDKMIEDALAAK